MQISGNSPAASAIMTVYQNKSTKTETVPSFQQVQEPRCTNEADTSSTISETDLPVQAYAMPSWYGEYLSDAMYVAPTLNYDLFDFTAEFTKENYMSDDDRNQIKKYLKNSPIHQDMLAKREFRNKFKNELSEYHDLLGNYFREALRENGVNTYSQADYYEKAILDKDNSEKIHQSMQERIEKDPRCLELMKILGI